MTDDTHTPTALASMEAPRRRVDLLMMRRTDRERDAARTRMQLAETADQLQLAPRVTDALETLSERLFKEVLQVVERQCTRALQEVLDQPIELKTTATFKRGAAAVEFSINNDGNEEDILRGQGGSVANILSVSLRMLALARCDPKKHRNFLVLDEQDCWLRPDLVPKLVRIVQQAGRTLGFQIIMISHHDRSIFERYADRLYEFKPRMGGVVEVLEVSNAADVADGGG